MKFRKHLVMSAIVSMLVICLFPASNEVSALGSTDIKVQKIKINGRTWGTPVEGGWAAKKKWHPVLGVNCTLELGGENTLATVIYDLDVQTFFQSTDQTCSAASTVSVLNYLGVYHNLSDTADRNFITENKEYNNVVDTMSKVINKYIKNSYSIKDAYAAKGCKTLKQFEETIESSLSKNCPLIILICGGENSQAPENFYNYFSNTSKTRGHFLTITGLFKDKQGKLWVQCQDPWAGKKGKAEWKGVYANSKTGVVYVPMDELFNISKARFDEGKAYLVYGKKTVYTESFLTQTKNTKNKRFNTSRLLYD